ncbi:hypothetical protein ACJMK2_019396 [Sinanodonta woodiana]|uniref:Uncharacterized protein n=1 Tax=Sinanodonta woodiana TaxID=1069815 RepID=A0ABD3UJS1_SINWO
MFLYCNIVHCTIQLTFAWKNVSRNIASCEHDDVQLTWEYDLNPGEYIKAKTWFTGANKTAKRIAYWKDTDGLKIEPAYTDRVTLAGSGKDSLILKRVTTSDDGMYTLIPSFPLSSEPDPRLALKLSIYVPPLQGKTCCTPQINATNDELHAFLEYEQGCGKPAPAVNWIVSGNKMVRNSTLILGDNDGGGTYKVCLTGPAVDTCFKGDKETLCATYTVPTKQPMRKCPQTTEQAIPLVAGLSVGGTIILVTVLLVLILKVNWIRIQTYRWRNKKWKAIRATLHFEDDHMLLQSLIPNEEVMKEIANCMYVIFKSSRELALEEINTTHVALENSEIIYIDNDTDSGYGGNLMKDRHINPSYAQSFYHKDKLLKLLVVQGELSVMKNTWCRKLVSTWCKAYECQYHQTPVQTNDENIQTMQSFPLLFFVSLRNAKKGQTLTNIIKQQSMIGNDTQNGDFDANLDLLMKNRPDKLIFIIHGVDEAEADVDILKEIVSQTINSLTILTCRDWGPLRSKCRIQEKDYRPMAYLTL